nr:hypothetical protein [Tanacetum cinerariifolium]
TDLRFKVNIVEAKNASLRTRIKTMEAIKEITCKRERQARVEIEKQLAAVQESQRQDRKNLQMLKELVMAAPTIPVSVEEHLRDPLDIRMDIIHPELDTVVAFRTAAVLLAAVQESQRQDRENFKMLKELVTSQFRKHS